MKIFLKTAFILTLILTLCGCFDYKEIEESYVISALGFDKVKNEFTVCLETANSEKNRVFSASGDDFSKVFENIGKTCSKKLEFSHTASIVLGDGLNAKTQKEAINFCRSIKNLSPSAAVVRTNSAATLLECEPYDKTVGFDIVKILEKNKASPSYLYEFSEDKEVLLPYFETSLNGIVLSENRRSYVG